MPNKMSLNGFPPRRQPGQSIDLVLVAAGKKLPLDPLCSGPDRGGDGTAPVTQRHMCPLPSPPLSQPIAVSLTALCCGMVGKERPWKRSGTAVIFRSLTRSTLKTSW